MARVPESTHNAVGPLIGAVGFVLLIACLNVANLLLGRSVLRERELAVRAALGSGPGRLVRQLFIESLLLSALGSVLGVAFAFGAVQYFRHANPVELPVGADVSIHLPVLAFTALLAVATTFAFGLLPAWRASRVDVNQVLKASGRGMVTGPRRSLAWLLVMAEVALSVMLLTGGGLLMRSVLRMESAPLGFNPQHLIAVRTGLPEDRYSGAPRLLQFFDRARQTAGALPGVRGVAVSADRKTYNQTLEIQGAPSTEAYNVDEQAAGSEFFQVLGVPLLRGRIFDARDSRESEYVAIVNQALAREYFRGTDPIGRRVRIGAPRKSGPWLTIVGVVGNVKHTAVYKEMSLVESPELFRPLTQEPPRSVAIHVRMEGDQAAIGAEIQRRIAALDPELAIEIEPAAFEISKALAYPRFRALVFGAFAICALLLAAIGLHGVLGQAVARRAPEFGLRMALGARRSDIFRLVARQGGLPILAGAAAGILGSLALGRLLGSLLYGVRPTDPSTLASGVLLLLASGAAAITLPALRAAKADPMAALRDE